MVPELRKASPASLQTPVSSQGNNMYLAFDVRSRMTSERDSEGRSAVPLLLIMEQHRNRTSQHFAQATVPQDGTSRSLSAHTRQSEAST